MRVLVVEDEFFIRADLESRLNRYGADVVASCTEGKRAISLAAEHQPDLILMDIKLKGQMTGIEAALEIVQRIVCDIVFISAFDSPDYNRIVTHSAGKVGYHSKPIADSVLRMILEEYGKE